MRLTDNWKDILRKAWSVRFIVLAAILSGAEVILPFFADAIPRGLFAVLTFGAVAGAFMSRIVAQKDIT
jgi:hypothetical protein